MAKKVEWSHASVRDRYEIYHFWIEKSKSNVYSQKLEILFNEAAKLISEFPEIGTATDFIDVRVKVIRSYKLFYLNHPDRIQIIRIWDSRQNPENLKLA
jgi:toxin YoeB